MIIKYEFLNGEKIEVEISDDLGNTILQIEKDTKNRDRRETRRHQSLNELQNEIQDKTVDIEEEILKRIDLDKLQKAIFKLKPSEQELLHKLYLDKHIRTQVQYSKLLGITENTVKQKVKWLKSKFKKLLLDKS